MASEYSWGVEIAILKKKTMKIYLAKQMVNCLCLFTYILANNLVSKHQNVVQKYFDGLKQDHVSEAEIL